MKKTNAVRLVEKGGVKHRLVEYPVDPTDLSAETVAGKIGLAYGQVLKTLLVRGDKALYFAVVPTGMSLSLKALAKAAGERKVTMVPVKEIQGLTGYIRGGVTVLGAKKPYPVFVHESARDHREVSVSGGRRGLQILLHPRDYVELVGGTLSNIAVPEA